VAVFFFFLAGVFALGFLTGGLNFFFQNGELAYT
jgi:hypothetical protein